MPSSLRVCIVTPRLLGPSAPSAIGHACFWQAQVLSSTKHRVTVLHTGGIVNQIEPSWARHFAKTAGWSYVDLFREPEAVRASLTTRSTSLDVADATYAWLHARSFDVVLFQEFLGHGGRTLQARAAGAAIATAATAVVVHGPRQWIYDGAKQLPACADDVVVDSLERESTRLADAVIAPSSYMALEVQRRWNRHCQVLPYCGDPGLAAEPSPVRHRERFTRLVFFGSLTAGKGLDLFCDAVAGLDPGQIDRITFLGPRRPDDRGSSEPLLRARCGAADRIQIDLIDSLAGDAALAWLQSQSATLVVAPRVHENVAYALLDLHARRIPFVTTDVGAAREIVGAANAGWIAPASAEGLRDVIARVLASPALTIDYRSGYQVEAANAAHVELIERLGAEARGRSRASIAAGGTFGSRAPVVVVTGSTDVELVRARSAAVWPSSSAMDWMTATEWAAREDASPAIVLDARVQPTPGFWTFLTGATQQPGACMSTSGFVRNGDVYRPLGRALEAGWKTNVFGGPCFAVTPAAVPAVRAALKTGVSSEWLVYAAAALAGCDIGVVPDPLYGVDSDTTESGASSIERQQTLDAYATAAGTVDLGWMLKTSGIDVAPAMVSNARPAEREAATPAVDLAEPTLTDLRARLEPWLAGWQLDVPRILVAGAGPRSRQVLDDMPELERYVAGFIDDGSDEDEVCAPRLHPERVDASLADVILYPSQKYMTGAYQAIVRSNIEHIPLFGPWSQRVGGNRIAKRFRRRLPPRTGLDRMFSPPDWAKGHISVGDARFLFDIIQASDPRHVLELGVASGASSAAILCALDHLPQPRARRLESVDLHRTCYFDPRRAVGEAVTAMYPAASAQWTLHTGEAARDCAQRRDQVDLLFLDASHYHPWPLLDVLHLSTRLRPGAWVVLHDVELPRLDPRFQMWGPHLLYAAWPYNKVHASGEVVNIAAVQMPEDPHALVPIALALIEERWEHVPAEDEVELPEAFAAVSARLAGRLEPVRRTMPA